jgi:hypothetical protein
MRYQTSNPLSCLLLPLIERALIPSKIGGTDA